jgi:hypothetical protein
MITCPNCRHQELAGALFCSECGTQLRDYGELNTHPFAVKQVDQASLNVEVDGSAGYSNSAVATSPPKEDLVNLFIVDAKKTIPLRGRSEYTLGRVAEDQPIIPDIDLTEFEAYLMGVSRLHATLKVGPQRISIRDLGSSNGTRVNGQRIVPHVDYPLKPGDAVALGKLVIQIQISSV